MRNFFKILITFFGVTIIVHTILDAGTSADDVLSELVMWIASIFAGGFAANKVFYYIDHLD